MRGKGYDTGGDAGGAEPAPRPARILSNGMATMDDQQAKTNQDLADRIYREKATLAQMVGIYCKGNRHQGRAGDGSADVAFASDMPPRVADAIANMCPSCHELVEYCFGRIDRCPHMATKTFCSSCETHCFAPEMRERIRQVMRYAGPRMLLYDPKGALKHLRDTRRAKKAKRGDC